VREKHVEQSLEQQIQRVSMFEEIVRERIAQGTVLIDIAGAKVGQVNGLALLDLGDHEFAQPSRITATTAMAAAASSPSTARPRCRGRSTPRAC